ncbi:equilibrative nucleoside transporter 1-like isoform X2 [Babylonia areolata]|uniref:equilibrative nucleoside transporter 1-like isoform X2 n=1 Tax=Babylonia areolata TaxID=304850 RepID=UPI003FCFF72E
MASAAVEETRNSDQHSKIVDDDSPDSNHAAENELQSFLPEPVLSPSSTTTSRTEDGDEIENASPSGGLDDAAAENGDIVDDVTANDDVTAPGDDAALQELARREPGDRYHLVYLIMVVHGIGILMPWNMLINAKSYFEDHKLLQGKRTTPVLKDYADNFMSYLGMACQYPCVLMNLLNLFVQCGGKPGVRVNGRRRVSSILGKPGVRIIGSLIIIIIGFIVTIVLAMVDSSDWPEEFFWITMVTAFVMCSAGGVYQNSLFGVAASLPMKYTNAIVFGNNFAGTLVSVVNILFQAISPSIASSAMYYFATAIVVLLVAADSYFLLPHTKFYRHHKKVMRLNARQRQSARPQHESCVDRFHTYWKVFKQIWHLALSVWFVFFVSLALFPQIQSDVKRLSFPISDVYWTPVFCFLNFNLFAMLGNLLTEFRHFPGPRWVWLPVALRVLFIPLYLMFNFRPESRSWAPPLANDYVFLVCSVLMALSGGYFSSLCMMYAPKYVERYDAGTAAMMMSFFLVFGILCGVNISRVLVDLVDL